MALPKYLNDIYREIETLPSFERTDEQRELFGELTALDQFLESMGLSREELESLRQTSVGGDKCPCCGCHRPAKKT